MNKSQHSTLILAAGCALGGLLYLHLAQRVFNLLPQWMVGKQEASLHPVLGKTRRLPPSSSSVSFEKIAFLEVRNSRRTGFFKEFYEVREPEMIAGFLKVVQEAHPPSLCDPVGFHSERNFIDASCPSFITFHYKPVNGVTPQPVCQEHSGDLVETYGVSMQEMLHRLGKFRAEKTKQWIANHANEVVKVEWATGRCSDSEPSDFQVKPLLTGTTDRNEIAALLLQLRNVDERCFAYGESVGICPIQLTKRDGSTFLLKMEPARDLTRKDAWLPDPTCPLWLREYCKRLEAGERTLSRPVPPPFPISDPIEK